MGVLIHWGNGDWGWVFGEGLEMKLEGTGLEELAWLMGEGKGDDNKVKRGKKWNRTATTKNKSRQRREPNSTANKWK